jgi:hypothetical protein
MVKKYVCIACSFLAINVFNQGNTLCSPCISQQNIPKAHRTWTEYRHSISSPLLYQNSSRSPRLWGLSCHCAGSICFITNPTQHSPSWEANTYSASQKIPCIYAIWKFIIKFQRPGPASWSSVRASDYWSSGPGFESWFYHGDFSLKWKIPMVTMVWVV